MDLALQALPVVPCQQERLTWMGRVRFSSSQLNLLARRPQLPRCRGTESEGDVYQENHVHKEELPPIEPASSVDSGSWLQDNKENADTYFGWASDRSKQPHSQSVSGWMKIGGVAILAIGFALGARSMYTRRDVTKEFAVPPPATEETFNTPSVVAKTAEKEEHEVTNENSASNDIAGDSLKGEKESIGNKEESDVQSEEKGISDQTPVGNEKTEDYRGNEFGDKDSPASGILPASEKLEPEGIMETSATIGDLLPSSEDGREKGSGLEMPGLMDVSKFNVEEPSQESAKTANGIEVVDHLDADMSFPGFTSVEGHDAERVFEEPDMLNTASKELANEGNDFSAAATSLPQPNLDGSSLHSLNNVKGLPGATVDLDALGSLARERGLKWGEGKPSTAFFASPVELNTITAPSTPSDGLPNLSGKVVVPGPVDHMQEQVLAALQALKVIEADVKPADICTRREYARWLMAASAILTRSPAHKVLPAMYIENASELAYEDVLPEDQDFPFIQGLAEAGLLSSRLLGDDKQHGLDKDEDFLFAPDGPLTRQDLVTWKIALERKPAVLDEMPSSDCVEARQKNFGFIDVDQIHKDAWPALLVDIKAGEQSITALAFGHTRRFQPQKPVSKAQAAVALAAGEAWELVAEELTRLEAESVAEAAVVAELALETKAQQEVADSFKELLQVERDKHWEAVSLVESTQAKLEQIKADHESEKYSLLKERAALDSLKEFLSSSRLEVEEHALALSNAKLEVAFQREQADRLRAEAEEEKVLISKARSELEIEKNALILARSWAEDEARKAQAHSKVLEEARNRFESPGVQVNAEKKLDTIDKNGNSISSSWQPSEGSQDQTLPMEGLIRKSKDVVQMFVDAFIRFLQLIQRIFHAIKEHATNMFGKLGGQFHEARIKCADSTTKTFEGLKQTVPSSVSGLTSNIREGTLKVVDDWREGAEKLSQKFKTS